jgi:hypothetical protein
MEKQPVYLEEYNKFLDSYQHGEISGEEVGEKVSRMAQHFAMLNLDMVSKERALRLVARDVESQKDDNGKLISSAKAEALIDATEEANEYRVARAHLQNVEQIINALKALQKGVLNEFSHMGS